MLCRVPSALLAPDLLLSSQLLFLFLHLRVRVMDQVKKDMEADDKLRKDWEKAQL